jgi:hypothetical protein
LGKSTSIDLQRVSPETPKHFSIVQRDDGLFQIGLADLAPGPFVTRKFAESVAAQYVAAPA